MSTFSQRYLGHHRYFSDAIEDILALTLCFPFTMILYWWNDLSDRLSESSLLPRSVGSITWNAGRFLFTIPLFVLKGIASLTITPFLAAAYALQSKKPARSRFVLGQYFQKFALILNPIIKLIFKLILICIVGAQVDVLLQFEAVTDFLIVGATIGLLVYPLIPYLAVCSATLLSLFAGGVFLGTLEGRFSLNKKLFTYVLDTFIPLAQLTLFWLKINPFKNKEDIASGELIEDLPWENIFVTNSNHAFDLSALESGVNVGGLKNYHAARIEEGSLPRFEFEEVIRLEKHPKLQENFPQLANYVREHKAEYQVGNNRKISPETLSVLRNFADKMALPQATNSFAEEFIVAKLAFETHLAAIAPAEKEEVENLNLLGGTDEEYKLKNVLPKVYNGSWCKKGASRLIKESCDRVSYLENNDDNVRVFWHRSEPSHWLGLDFVLRLR